MTSIDHLRDKIGRIKEGIGGVAARQDHFHVSGSTFEHIENGSGRNKAIAKGHVDLIKDDKIVFTACNSSLGQTKPPFRLRIIFGLRTSRPNEIGPPRPFEGDGRQGLEKSHLSISLPTFEKLYDGNTSSMAEKTYGQPDGTGRLALAVTGINLNEPFCRHAASSP